jgi:DNA end-binding protein Ku
MIERKAQGKEIAVQPEAEEVAAPAPDLMGALKASLEAVRARDAEGDGAAKPRKRKAAAKRPAKKAAAKAPKPAARKGSGSSPKRGSSRATAKR